MSITVKQARVGKDFTMQEVADKMGIHVQTYAKLEKDPEQFTIRQAEDFCGIVEVPMEKIFFGIKSN